MKSIAVAMTVLLLAACVGSMERNAPTPTVYRLTAPIVPEGPAIGADLLVLRPVLAPGLRTDRIANSWAGNRIDYFAGARWSGELGSVVQGALVQALRTTGRLRTVEGEPGRFLATHVLDVEVTRFEADYAAGGAPIARVTLVATVARHDHRKALMAATAAAETVAGANTLTSVIAALDGAFGKAATDVVLRANDTIAADLAGQPAD